MTKQMFMGYMLQRADLLLEGNPYLAPPLEPMPQQPKPAVATPQPAGRDVGIAHRSLAALAAPYRRSSGIVSALRNRLFGCLG